MKNFFLISLVVTFIPFSSAYAVDIAKCSGLKGHAYYLNGGFTNPKDSGWQEDSISKGKTQLILNEAGHFDIMYVDATENIVSMKADGAKIFFVSETEKDVSFIASYPSGIIELYSFFQEKDGKNRYSLFSLKNENGTFAPKRSLMVGDCDSINFEAIKRNTAKQ